MRGHNFGGLKATGASQPAALFSTSEGYGAASRQVSARFRTYASAAEGASDYLRTLRADYPEAFRGLVRGQAGEFVDGLVEGRYFTGDPSVYRRSVRALASEYLMPRGPLVEAPFFLVEGVLRAFGWALIRG
jgi:flagellum-specific peptidoglycan hydrolase FlgJ